MPRLPTPGSDSGQWGDILNAFLLVEHNSDGTLKNPSIPAADKGAVGGVAELDGGGKVPTSQLPAAALAGDATSTDKGVLRLTGDLGGTAVSPTVPGLASKADASSVLVKTNNFSDLNNFTTARQNLGVAIGSDVQAWDAELDTWSTKTAPAGIVLGTTDAQILTNKTLTSPVINSPTGIVKGDVGLGNVDNTSDANKPTSTATQTALDLKENLSNKSTSTSLGTSDTLYPTQNAVKAYVDTSAGAYVPLAGGTMTGALTVNTAPSTTVGSGTSQITITPASSLSGASLLYFNTDRAWGFAQNGTGAGTALDLRNYSSDKYFDIYQNGTSTRALSVYTSATATNNAVGVYVQPSPGAGALQLGSTATGGLTWHNTVDMTTNYERVSGKWISNAFHIVHEAGGTGTLRSVNISTWATAGAGTPGRIFTVSPSTPFFNFNWGATGLTGNMITASSTLSGSSGTQTVLSLSPTLNQSSTAAFKMLEINPSITAIGSGTNYLIDVQYGSSPRLQVFSSATATNSTLVSAPNGAGDVALAIQNNATTANETASLLFYTSTSTTSPFGRVRTTRVDGANSRLSIGPVTASSIVDHIQLYGDTGLMSLGASSVPANGLVTIGTNTTTAASGMYFGTDTNLYRSAADTLRTDDLFYAPGHYVGSTGTGFRLYNTADEVTNTEYGRLYWSSNVLTLRTDSAGTGIARDIQFTTGGSTFLSLSAAGATAATVSRNTTAIAGLFKVSSTSLTGSSGIQTAIEVDTTLNQSSTAGYTLIKANATQTATGSGAKNLLDLQVGGVSQFTVDNTGKLSWQSDTNLYRSSADNLKTDDRFRAAGGLFVDVSTTTALQASQPLGNAFIANYLINGDANASFRIKGDGTHEWGPGGASALDTNLYRSAADTLKTDDNLIVAAAGTVANSVATIDATQTLTNKRLAPRVTTITSSATPTVNTDNCDAVTITALATAITSMTSGLSGTPVNFQKLMIRIKDDGTARSITWGASFVSRGVTLPTSTVISKLLTVGLVYNSVTSTWDCVAVAQEA